MARVSGLDQKHFENVRDQISYCGLWCGSCAVGNGTLAEMSRRNEEVIRKYGVDQWGPRDFDVEEFMKGLASMQNMHVCQGCLKGDGKSGCAIRACALSKKQTDCIECGQHLTCKNNEALRKVREGALDVYMLVKTRKANRKELIEKWTSELINKWPGCMVFCHSMEDKKSRPDHHYSVR
jgi:hypothetical protein